MKTQRFLLITALIAFAFMFTSCTNNSGKNIRENNKNPNRENHNKSKDERRAGALQKLVARKEEDDKDLKEKILDLICVLEALLPEQPEDVKTMLIEIQSGLHGFSEETLNLLKEMVAYGQHNEQELKKAIAAIKKDIANVKPTDFNTALNNALKKVKNEVKVTEEASNLILAYIKSIVDAQDGYDVYMGVWNDLTTAKK